MKKADRESSGFWLSTRFGLACVAFLGFANLYALRVNISFAMVCMVKHSVHTLSHNLSSPNDSLISQQSSQFEGDFDWTKKQQGLILGSFFIGYMVTQIPGGLLAKRFGGKNVFLWPMLVAAVCTLLCPFVASIHYILLIAMRVLIGLCEGVVFPAMHTIWAGWAPPLERSRLIGFSYAGCQIGNVVTMPMSALLCQYIGWQSVFYIFGLLGALWCLLWFVYASDSPDSSKRISAKEREYIDACLVGQMEKGEQSNERTPWLTFLRSAPVWAIVVAHTTSNFGTYLVLTNLPTFMSEVLKFDIKSNGFLSALPFIAYWMGITLAGFCADLFIRKRILNTTHVRKLFQFIALMGQACALVGTGYCSAEQQYLAVGLLTLAQGISGLQYAGFVVNHVDIAPRYAGTLFGISNTVATISGILAPYVAASLTPDKTVLQWRSVFLVAGAILCFGAVFFAIFASGQLQSWAAVSTEKPYHTVKQEEIQSETQQTNTFL